MMDANYTLIVIIIVAALLMLVMLLLMLNMKSLLLVVVLWLLLQWLLLWIVAALPGPGRHFDYELSSADFLLYYCAVFSCCYYSVMGEKGKGKQ